MAKKRVIPTFPGDDDWTLGDTRDWLRDQVDTGADCPCCRRFTKVYQRALPNATVRVMIILWHLDEGDGEYVFVPDILDTMTGTAAHGGDGTKGELWGLMEAFVGKRPDGSSRMGWWRLTDLGRDFIQGKVTVPKYALVYNKKCLGHSGPPWSARQALGSKFDYDKLMRGV